MAFISVLTSLLVLFVYALGIAIMILLFILLLKTIKLVDKSINQKEYPKITDTLK